MTKNSASAVIDAPIGAVWAKMRDFNGLPDSHPRFSRSHIEGGLRSDTISNTLNEARQRQQRHALLPMLSACGARICPPFTRLDVNVSRSPERFVRSKRSSQPIAQAGRASKTCWM